MHGAAWRYGCPCLCVPVDGRVTCAEFDWVHGVGRERVRNRAFATARWAACSCAQTCGRIGMAARARRGDARLLCPLAPSHCPLALALVQTGMKALERRHPDSPMRPTHPVKREVEHVSHGTLCRMGAYDERRWKLFSFVSEDHDSQTFVD